MKKTVTVKIPAELEYQLRETAAESGETASNVVREALAEYFAKPQRIRKGNALQLLGDLAGSLEGPSDLATNKRHLKVYLQPCT